MGVSVIYFPPPRMTLRRRRSLKDICALWPEIRWPVANVLCEGPSFRTLDHQALLLGPTIAVNRAIATHVPVDFWATSDDPRNLWAWAEPYRHPALRYFSTDQNAHIWVDLLPGLELQKLYSTHHTEMGRDEQGLAVILPTVMPTLAWLLRLGVKRVRLFGADMVGMGSPISGDWKRDPDRSWESRWKIERVLLSHVARIYRGRGARIERWNHSPLETARSSSCGTLPLAS